MENSFDFFAGCLGGAAGVIVGHPFDTVKVRLQLQSSKNPQYKGMVNCFTSIVQKEGTLGLYKGVTSPLYSLALINALVFGVQGNLMRRVDNPNSLTSVFAAGAITGAVQSVVTSPMELIKTQMQMQGEGERTRSGSNRNYSSCLDTFNEIRRARGVQGVYRGFIITLVRELPSFGFYFGTYDYLCRIFTADQQVHCPTWGLLVAGGFAGCASWLICYPCDVIKSRYQADGVWEDGRLVYRYTGYRECLRVCIEENGCRGLFTGFGTTMLRAFPTNGAIFAVVTLTLRYLSPSPASTTTSHHN